MLKARWAIGDAIPARVGTYKYGIACRQLNNALAAGTARGLIMHRKGCGCRRRICGLAIACGLHERRQPWSDLTTRARDRVDLG